MSLEIYKASAGSGKTYRLALEYITLALSSESPNAFSHILAVTFTNKATGEMKDRILSYLYDLAFLGREQHFMEEVCRTLHVTHEVVSERAASALHAILHDYDHFRVETIDSFFQFLLSNLAYELGLARGFRINLDTTEIVSRAVDRLLLSVERADRKKRKVNTSVQLFMEEKLEDGKGWAIANDLKNFASKNVFSEDYVESEDRLQTFFQDPDLIRQYRRRLQQVREEKRQHILGAATHLVEVMEAHRGVPGIKKALFSTTFINSVKREDYTVALTTTLEKATVDPLSAINKKDQTKTDAIEAMHEIAEAAKLFLKARKESLKTLYTVELSLNYLMPLSLIHEIGNEITTINSETDSFMLARTPTLFSKMGREDSSFVFERAGTSFSHVMIDEFQDTSRIQWEVFRKLLLENIAQGEMNMVVGDVKQSIYRWRGGDWNILYDLKHNISMLGEVREHTLDTNFRSKGSIIAFNNAFFRHAVGAINVANIGDGFDHDNTIEGLYEDVEQKVRPGNEEGGYVRLSLHDKGDDDQSILNDVYEQIVHLHNELGVPYDQINILVRRNREAVQIINFFAEHHPDEIPLTSDEAFKLEASPAVMLLIAAVKYLNAPKEDTVSCELCLKLQAQLSELSGVATSFHADDLLSQRDKLLAMPLYELFQRLIRYFGLSDIETGHGGQTAYLYSFLDHVLTYLDEHASDLTDFIGYWDDSLHEKAISIEVKDSVYIMTIHKSKGLQRHTVMIPFCNWKMDNDRPDDMIWCRPSEVIPEDEEDLSLLRYQPIVPINPYNSTKVRESAFSGPYNKEHLYQRIDNLNTLYVAFTRPEQNLFVWGKNGVKSGGLTAKDLLSSFVSEDTSTKDVPMIKEWGTLMPYQSRRSEQSDNPLVIHDRQDLDIRFCETSTSIQLRQSNDARDFITEVVQHAIEDGEEMILDSSRKQREYIDKGKLLHFLFSLIRTEEDIPAAMTVGRSRGLFSSPEEERSLAALIGKRLQDPQVREWFDGTWQTFSECNILSVSAEGKLIERRPDRVLCRDGRVIVIDYKFGHPQDKYIIQVQEYMQALHQMGHEDVEGYLWYVYPGDIRPVPVPWS